MIAVRKLLAAAVIPALVAVCLLGFVSTPSQAGNGPCEDKYGNVVVGCEVQVFSINLSRAKPVYWALYCPASAPYYWGAWEAAWSGKFGTIVENLLAETTPDKLDFSFDNFNTHDINLTLFYGCSASSPWGQSCTGKVVSKLDPGCPIDGGSQHTVCAGSDEDQTCWQEWNETCSNGGTYTCNNTLVVRACTGCSGSGDGKPISGRLQELQGGP